MRTKEPAVPSNTFFGRLFFEGANKKFEFFLKKLIILLKKCMINNNSNILNTINTHIILVLENINITVVVTCSDTFFRRW